MKKMGIKSKMGMVIVIALVLNVFGTAVVQSADEGYTISKNSDYSTEDREFVQITDTIYMKIWSSIVGDNPKTKKWQITDSQDYKLGGSLSPDGYSPGGTLTFVAETSASYFAVGPASLTMQLRSGKNNFKVTEAITILGGGNQPPPAPSWIEPDVTDDNTPHIYWESVTDPDGDTVNYYIKIGTASGASDVLPETSTGTDAYYDVSVPLSDGVYYVNVKSYDGEFFSDWHQETMVILAEPSPWSIQTVDTEGWSTLAYDPVGNPAIGYPDYDTNNVMFAHWNGASWDIETVDHPSDELGGRVYLAYDPNDGNPSLSYIHGDSLNFAHWIGSSWDITVVEGRAVSYYVPSLAYDNDGNPSISFLGGKGKNGGIRFASFDPGTNSWDVETVDPCGKNKHLYISSAYDADGNPSIAYSDDYYYDIVGIETLKFAHWNPASQSWDVEIVESGSDYSSFGHDVNLAYDPTTGYPSIAHGWDEVRFLSWNGNNWDLETFDASQHRTGTSLAYGSDGTAFISYAGSYSSEPSLVKFASRTGPDNWETEIIDVIQGGTHTSLKFDQDGNPSLSYSNYHTSELKFALRNPSV